MDDDSKLDVIVVGAGAAGLWAAVTLREAGKSVVVVEAKDRVGGRLKCGKLRDEVVDLGGQWVGPGQDWSFKVAARYGMKTYPTPTIGKILYEFEGEIYDEDDDTGVINNAVTSPLATVDKWAAKLREPSFWEGAGPVEWDEKTLASWLTETIDDARGREFLQSLTQGMMTAPPCQISMLSFFGSFLESTIAEECSTTDGALESCFLGGFHQITTHMAAELGESVILGAPVRGIAQDSSSVTVETDKGAWRASRVIVAAPPPMASRIDYTPELPFQKSGYMDRMPMGSVIKCLLAYSTRFWNEQGYAGHGFTTSGVIGGMFDVTPPGYDGGILAGFICGNNAQIWSDSTTGQRRQRVAEDIARMLGPEALEPLDYVENVWTTEPWILGGYSCMPLLGTYSIFGDSLADPCGRIHWAGTETANKNVGYVDGALRSGERAANEVVALL